MTARRAGQMIQKGDNKWLLRWYVGRTLEGKRQYASKVFEGTHFQAQRELARATTSVVEQTFVPPAKQTVHEYLTWWLAEVCAQSVQPSTRASYERRLRMDIYPTLGMLKLDKLTWQAVQSVYNQLRASGKSGRTVAYTHTVLRHALGHAVKGKLLRDNPCDHATPGTHEKREMLVWTAEQVQVFLDRTKGDRDYPLWYTLLHTGLRPGEAFGLKWSDIADGRLQVLRAVAQQGDGTYALESPKTARSKRSVPITEANAAILAAHRKAQVAEMLAAGEHWTRNDFVFPGPTGAFDTDRYARRRWLRAVDRVNRILAGEQAKIAASDRQKLPGIRLYDTRHTHATLLLKAGVHPKVVQERLGHASITITLDTYTHVLPDMQEEALGKLDTLMQQAAGSLS